VSLLYVQIICFYDARQGLLGERTPRLSGARKQGRIETRRTRSTRRRKDGASREAQTLAFLAFFVCFVFFVSN